MFLNLKGREASGIVEPGDEARSLKRELISAWNGLRDEERAAVGINAAFDAEDLYTGPYKGNAPDLIVGYNDGYRVSWDCAVGVVAGPVFSDNTKAWSGDHCVDPRLVPGRVFQQPSGRPRMTTCRCSTWRPPRWPCSASTSRTTWRASRSSIRRLSTARL